MLRRAWHPPSCSCVTASPRTRVPRPATSDAPRALTEDGIVRMRLAAAGVATLDLGIDAVVSSPLVRCRQTGEIVAGRPGAGAGRGSASAPRAWTSTTSRTLLIEHPDAQAVLLCGHQPDLSLLVAALTAGGSVEFRKGSLAVLGIEAPRRGGGRLRALYPPASLRWLGAAAG